MAHKVYDTHVVGVLATDEYAMKNSGREAILINSQHSLQFYFQVISPTPGEITSDIKLVTAYTSDIAQGGFVDPEEEVPENRKNALKDFMDDRLVVFNLQEKRIGLGQTEIYCAADAVVYKRPHGFNDKMRFTPVPLYCEEKHGTMIEFESKLQENRPLGRIENVPHGDEDTPEFIIWKNNEDDFFVYGAIESHTWNNPTSSCTYKFKGEIRKIGFSAEWFKESIPDADVMFVSNQVYRVMADRLYTDDLAPLPNKVDKTKDEKQETTEQEFLESFFDTAREKGLLFDEKDLINFHTAMKSSNLVILAGMSGTGKSQLVEVYAKALGLSGKQVNIIPVRPYWSDDADLIGYVDAKNNVYRPGDSGLIDTLKNAEDSNQLHIVAFDEMNLARVEHYFSQFLSVLESTSPRKLRLYNEKLAPRLFNAMEYSPTITLGENIMFVGTVNLDESTHHFSDKVLDRANVINLMVLPFHKLRDMKMQNVQRDPVSFKEFYGFKNRNNSVQLSDREFQFLEEVHRLLHTNNQQHGVGFRIVRQVDLYLKNIPDQEYLTRHDAFDLQFVQRIMTKIRGSEEDLKPIVLDGGLLSLFDEFPDVSPFDVSRNALNQKAKELKMHGFTV